MKTIKKTFLVDEHQKKVAVQIDVETFEKIEKVIEDYALIELMKENRKQDRMTLEEAEVIYRKQKKTE